MAAQFERIIRRVKQSMNYRGSYSTGDILGSLVARWVQSGEWARLKELPSDQRRIGESVRRFILDRLEQLRRRGDREELTEDQIAVPDDEALTEMIASAEIPLANPRQVGRALRLHLDGQAQRQIAAQLGVSLGAAHKRILEGTNYLIVLQGIEQGIGARE
jgi:hypothetical protein